MTSSQVGNPGSVTNRDDMQDQAREAIDKLPAETALGNPDPAAPSQEDPEQYEAEHTGQFRSTSD